MAKNPRPPGLYIVRGSTPEWLPKRPVTFQCMPVPPDGTTFPVGRYLVRRASGDGVATSQRGHVDDSNHLGKSHCDLKVPTFGSGLVDLPRAVSSIPVIC